MDFFLNAVRLIQWVARLLSKASVKDSIIEEVQLGALNISFSCIFYVVHTTVLDVEWINITAVCYSLNAYSALGAVGCASQPSSLGIFHHLSQLTHQESLCSPWWHCFSHRSCPQWQCWWAGCSVIPQRQSQGELLVSFWKEVWVTESGDPFSQQLWPWQSI